MVTETPRWEKSLTSSLYRATHQQPPGRTHKAEREGAHIYWSGPQGKKPPGAEAPPAPCCIFQPQVPAKVTRQGPMVGALRNSPVFNCLAGRQERSRTFCKVPFLPKGSSDSNQLLFPHSQSILKDDYK